MRMGLSHSYFIRSGSMFDRLLAKSAKDSSKAETIMEHTLQ